MARIATAALAARVEALEQRVGQLERARGLESPAAARERAAEPSSAIEGLKSSLGDAGGVMFAGSVTLPSGEQYVWQDGRPAPELLSESWSGLAHVLAALGNPVRLRLLQLVLTGTRTAAELGEDAELGTTGQIYHHLRQLITAGWLVQTARGRYAVPAGRVIPLLVSLAAAEHRA